MHSRTPLLVAVKNKHNYNAVRLLIEHAADVGHQDITGQTALHGFFNDTVKALIEFHQEDIENDGHDSYGMNVVHWVCWSKTSLPTDLHRCSSTNKALLEMLDNQGKTPLHYACERGNIAIIETLLLESKGKLPRADWKGRTLMHYATESGRSAHTIDILVREGYDIHAVDNQGKTILHHAAAVGNIAAVEKLLDLGADADLDSVDCDSRTPLQLAAWCSRPAVMEILRPRCRNAQDVELLEQRFANMPSCTPAPDRKSVLILDPVHSRRFLTFLGTCVLLWFVVQSWISRGLR